MESIFPSTKKLIKILKRDRDTIDMSEIRFIFPVQILPLAALISEKKLPYEKPSSLDCSGYLNHLGFPDGFTKFDRAASGHIPIYKFSGQELNSEKDEILKNLTDICLDKLGSPEGSVNALNVSIGEIIANIEDHSSADFGWINAQYYPSKKCLEMCILDKGIGISKRYQQVGKGFSNDLESLKNAIEGESSKKEKIRGSGLPTFTKMITQGFGGEMLIISGSAIVYANQKVAPIVKAITADWDGTIVAFRVPKNYKSIDYTKYID